MKSKNPKNIEAGKKAMAVRWKGHETIKSFTIDEFGGFFKYRGETYVFTNDPSIPSLARQDLLDRMFTKARELLNK